MKILTLILAVLTYGNCSAEKCSNLNTTGIQVSVSSQKNEKGQWIPRVHLQQGVPENDTLSWKLDVHHNVEKCGHSEILNVFVSLTPPRTVDKTYVLYPGIGYYKLHTRQVPWEEARQICESEGAHLAIVNSDDEAGALRRLIEKHINQPEFIYIGFHDKHTEGDFVTVLGGGLKNTGYYTWKKGEPNSLGGNEDCGTVNNQAQLNDIDCNAPLKFICEQELY